MPFVLPGADAPGAEEADSESHARARKIRPEFSRGPLVRVAGGRNQAEAELIQNLLLEEGIPSLERRSAGFDVPDFLAAGPRDVLVAESGAQLAHEVLFDADLAPAISAGGANTSVRHAAVLLLAVLAGGLLASLVAWALIGAAG
jgi:hypothetical protein